MFSSEPPEKLQLIAESILRLSDFYIKNPEGETPWDEKFCQLAYRYYYLPLNQFRVSQVIERAEQVNFFEGLSSFIDWGAGPGTASLALARNEKIKLQIKEQVLFDISDTVLKNFQDLHTHLVKPQYSTHYDLNRHKNQKESCLVFSYSLTEFLTLPQGWNKFEALMILEPSTGEDGRKLLELRQKLIDEGYSIWGPCTHQSGCPLLKESKHDWCHDRFKVEAPEWFLNLEQLLPMKNKTVTTSYLLARRKKAPEFLKTKARLTGDSLEEKGKTRQLVCRGEKREFLTWMHKNIQPQTLARGELIDTDFEFELKSNELRLSSKLRS